MTKTAYEIRADLLQQAQSILMEQNNAERMRIDNDWNMKYEIARIHSNNGVDSSITSYPKIPIVTTEEIIEEARKLNDFVSNG